MPRFARKSGWPVGSCAHRPAATAEGVVAQGSLGYTPCARPRVRLAASSTIEVVPQFAEIWPNAIVTSLLPALFLLIRSRLRRRPDARGDGRTGHEPLKQAGD